MAIEGVQQINDPSIVEAARAFLRNQAAHRRFEKAKKKLAEALRGVSAAQIGGEFLFSGHFEAGNVISVPQEIREQYKRFVRQAKFKWKVERIRKPKRARK